MDLMFGGVQPSSIPHYGRIATNNQNRTAIIHPVQPIPTFSSRQSALYNPNQQVYIQNPHAPGAQAPRPKVVPTAPRLIPNTPKPQQQIIRPSHQQPTYTTVYADTLRPVIPQVAPVPSVQVAIPQIVQKPPEQKLGYEEMCEIPDASKFTEEELLHRYKVMKQHNHLIVVKCMENDEVDLYILYTNNLPINTVYDALRYATTEFQPNKKLAVTYLVSKIWDVPQENETYHKKGYTAHEKIITFDEWNLMPFETWKKLTVFNKASDDSLFITNLIEGTASFLSPTAFNRCINIEKTFFSPEYVEEPIKKARMETED